MTGKVLLIAAGGTGGHMFPAQALAEVMLERGWQVQLSTDERGARYAGGFPEAVTISKVSSATLARGGILAKALAPLRILAGIFGATIKMAKQRPAVVVGFGGYPTIPALSAAYLLRRPRMIHEANGVLGRVNKLFAPRVDRVACGIWPTALPAGSKSHHTGNPVRGAILRRAGAPYIPPGDYPMQILVIGGSQGARILSQVVPSALAALPAPLKAHLRVVHQARDADAEAAQATYEAAGIRAEIAPFFTNIAERLAEAQIVISRSGASSVADISVIGRPSILIPFAAAMDDHQTANARGLADGEGAIVISEKALDVEGLSSHIAALLGDAAAASRMASNALAQGKPDAVLALAALVEELAGVRS